jgi:hypothetical protein
MLQFLPGVGWDRVHLVRRPLFGLLYQPRMTDNEEYEAIGGMRIGRRNWSTRRIPTPVPLRPPQIPHDLTWDRTSSAAVGSRRLTAWAMARPLTIPNPWYFKKFQSVRWVLRFILRTFLGTGTEITVDFFRSVAVQSRDVTETWSALTPWVLL